MTRYIVIITCRNGSETIEQAIYSWLEQTIKPVKIIIVNDGSMDDSYKKIMTIKLSHPEVELIEKPFTPYDVKRIALNWNDALEIAKYSVGQYDYHVIATEDSIYEPRYIERILEVMQVNTNLFACSGEYDNDRNSNIHSPHGIGRVVRQATFESLQWKGKYPYQCGFESAILYDAMRVGFTCSVMPYAEIKHLRQLGSIHRFIEWPQADKLLGHSWIYSTLRFINMVRHKQISLFKSIYLSYIFLSFKPDKSGYFSKYSNDMQKYIKHLEKEKMKEVLRLQ